MIDINYYWVTLFGVQASSSICIIFHIALLLHLLGYDGSENRLMLLAYEQQLLAKQYKNTGVLWKITIAYCLMNNYTQFAQESVSYTCVQEYTVKVVAQHIKCMLLVLFAPFSPISFTHSILGRCFVNLPLTKILRQQSGSTPKSLSCPSSLEDVGVEAEVPGVSVVL